MAKTRFHLYLYEFRDKEFPTAKNFNDTDFFDRDKFLSNFFRLCKNSLFPMGEILQTTKA